MSLHNRKTNQRESPWKMEKYNIIPCFYASYRKERKTKHCPQPINNIYYMHPGPSKKLPL